MQCGNVWERGMIEMHLNRQPLLPAVPPLRPPPHPAHLPAIGLTAARTAPLSPMLGPSRCSSSVSPPPPSGQASR